MQAHRGFESHPIRQFTFLAKPKCFSYAAQLMADEGKSRQDIWASEASLSLLGPVRLSARTGEDLTPKARKTRALLAVIALSKGNVPRSHLTNLLWGDRGEEQAKASLRQSLYELRSLTSAGLLTVTREFVSAGPKRLWTDVGAIESSLNKSDGAAFADALDEVQWPPLADLDDITPELDEWLRDERNRITSLVVQRGTELAEASLAERNATAARRIADSLQRLDSLDERVAQTGARADLALGDRAAAHRRISRFEQKMRDELGLEPSPATRALLAAAPAPGATPPKADAKPAQVDESRRKRWIVPAALAALVLLFAAAALFLRPSVAGANPSVAVLPFEDGGQKTQGYFAAGVSDEILNLLSHDKNIRVLGRVSAEEIANRPNALEAARDLGITHLLDGSVRSAGDRVLVIVTLTRVSDGAQLWSERYERRLGDIFKVQGDIASTVASRLAISFGKPVNQATSPEVYDRYLAARQLVRERREVTLEEADRLLREAIRMDPNYAPAYAELAQVLMLRSDHPTSYGRLPIDQARAEAQVFAKKSVELDPNLGDAYAAMGFIYLQDKRSAPYYRKAVELSPQRPEYHRWLATSLNQLNRFDESIVEYRRAIEIDPLWYINYEHLAGALAYVGRNQEARQVAARFLQLSGDDRAKLLLLRGVANNENRLADNLRYSKALLDGSPEERNNRFNYASALASLGENRRAAQYMTHEPITAALLRGDWAAFAREADRFGHNFWDRSTLWKSADLLVASGHSDELVRLYDEVQPLIRSGTIDGESVAIPATALALRNVGRAAEAERVVKAFATANSKLPRTGIGGVQRSLNEAMIAGLMGRNGEVLRILDAQSRSNPIGIMPIPAMSLIRVPYFSSVSSDPRLIAADERIRAAVNSERKKAGMPPLSRQAWVSDPKTLLTKN